MTTDEHGASAGDGTRAAARLLEIAARNADELLDEARAEATSIVTAAQTDADQLTASSEAQAKELTESAGAEADRVLAAAHTEADRVQAELEQTRKCRPRSSSSTARPCCPSLPNERTALRPRSPGWSSSRRSIETGCATT